MKTVDAVLHFGSQAKLARALGIAPSAVCQWGVCPPLGRQFQIELLTAGRLRAARRALAAVA